MPFKVLAIGDGARIPRLKYLVNKSRSHLTILIPLEDAEAAGLAVGDPVQFQVGEKEHAGIFALGKGKANARKLAESGKSLKIRIPLLSPIQKSFPGNHGTLRLVDANAKGVLAFSVA